MQIWPSHMHPSHSHYESWVGGHRVKWKLRDKYICSEPIQNIRVKVLSEELAYNKSLKQFKMFIIERPLDPLYKVHNLEEVVYVYLVEDPWEWMG